MAYDQGNGWPTVAYDLATEAAWSGTGGVVGDAPIGVGQRGGVYTASGDVVLDSDLTLACVARLVPRVVLAVSPPRCSLLAGGPSAV